MTEDSEKPLKQPKSPLVSHFRIGEIQSDGGRHIDPKDLNAPTFQRREQENYKDLPKSESGGNKGNN